MENKSCGKELEGNVEQILQKESPSQIMRYPCVAHK